MQAPSPSGSAQRWPPGSLLGLLDTDGQRALTRLGTQRTVERGEILVHEGDTDRTVFLLLRGCVKVVSASATGTSVMLAVRLAGDLVGELAALDGQPRSATVVAASRTTVRSIGVTEFRTHLDTSPAAADAVQRAVVAKLRQSTRMRSGTNGSSVLTRLAHVLTQLADRYGRDSPQGRLIDVQLTQAELGELIGAGEASVQRSLGELRHRGFIRTGYRQLLIGDPGALRAFADGDPG